LPAQDESATTAAIEALLLEYEPVALYVGKPTNLNNDNTASTEEALIFARRLQGQVSVPVIMVDERMSTAAAAAQLREAGRNSKNSRTIIDQAAAAVILESALSLEKSGKPAGAPIVDYTQ
jgi:putative Holliday junction resolvase